MVAKAALGALEAERAPESGRAISRDAGERLMHGPDRHSRILLPRNQGIDHEPGPGTRDL